MKYPEIKELATMLRNNPTKEESFLWKYLRKRQLMGKKFLRQHPIIYETCRNEHFFYIPDFYCAEKRLVIEMDGKIHEFSKDHDIKRDEILNEKGIKVLRIQNYELNNIEKVLELIKEKLRD